MPIQFTTNLGSTFAIRKLGENHAKLTRSQEHLASGARINRSADDAAGLAISEKTRSATRSLTRATHNIQDAFAFVDVADGAIQETSEILSRLRQLAVQAASGTWSDAERGMMEREVVELKGEIDRIARMTSYNGVYLMNGSAGTLDLQVGASADLAGSRIRLDASEYDITLERLGLGALSAATQDGARLAIGAIDDAFGIVSNARTSVGALGNRLEATRQNAMMYRMNLEAAHSRLWDADFAEETSELAKNQILLNASASMLSQANQSPTKSLRLLG